MFTSKVVVAVLIIVSAAFFAFGQQHQPKFANGQILVKYSQGTASRAAVESHQRFGTKVEQEFPSIGWQLVSLPKNMSVARAVDAFSKLYGVSAVQPNYYYKLHLTPNDPRYVNGDLWGMNKINAPAAWDISTGDANIVVANIDTGMRYTHQDLAANMWKNPGEIAGNGIDDDANGFVDDVYGYDFFYNDSDPIDENGHGTHTGGTIGGVGNNNLGVVGVNWNVKLMAIKIYDQTGFGSTSAMLINAYNYVTMMKERGVNIKVTNNSYGGCDEACGYDQATKDALDKMGEAGILNVFSAGNDGRDIDAQPAFPGSYNSPHIITVANSTMADARSGNSNYGVLSVDLAAPGSGILSTTRSTDSSYGNLSGTSMAAPHVAGSAALMLAADPTLSVATLKARLMNSVDTLANWQTLVRSGGRLNLGRAMTDNTVCTFSASPQTVNASAVGGEYLINVIAPQNCDFSAKSDVDWITIESGDTGSGNSAVSIKLTANSGPSRSATIDVAGNSISVSQAGSTLARSAAVDFDGDGKTDLSVLQNSGGSLIWHNLRSGSGYQAAQFGIFADDVAIPADFDGDGKADIAVWRNSTGIFYIFNSADNTYTIAQFGVSGDDPRISQDFDGDGKADLAVTRRSGGTLQWHIYGSATGYSSAQFGTSSDIPLRGDYDGDGKADIAVYRPQSGSPANTFFIYRSSDNGYTVTNFGLSAIDTPIPADFDGDGKTDLAVWRRTDGVWHFLQSSDGAYRALQFGMTGDLPTPGDYDGDGMADPSIWRPGSQSLFYVLRSGGGITVDGFGTDQMLPLANAFQIVD